jgi:zinc finger CCHC domain-containing protein 8
LTFCFTYSKADKDDSRCFNCGSYGHALKDCPKPRDNAAISNARKQHNLKRNQSSSSRVQNRYYQKTPGKYDDLIAGVLGPETRECLGVGVSDYLEHLKD